MALTLTGMVFLSGKFWLTKCTQHYCYRGNEFKFWDITLSVVFHENETVILNFLNTCTVFQDGSFIEHDKKTLQWGERHYFMLQFEKFTAWFHLYLQSNIFPQLHESGTIHFCQKHSSIYYSKYKILSSCTHHFKAWSLNNGHEWN